MTNILCSKRIYDIVKGRKAGECMEMTPIAMMQELLKCGTNIPLWHYDTDGHLLYTNAEHLVLDKILGFIGGTKYMLEYAEKSRKPLMLGSDMGLLWCAAFGSEKDALKSIYLIGPVYNAEVSDIYLAESASRYHIDPAFRKQYVSMMKGIPVVPGLMFQQYGLMLHYCVTGEKLNRSDIQFQPRNKMITPLSSEMEHPALDWAHTYTAEQTLLRMLREGDINYKQAIAQADHLFNALYPRHRGSFQSAIISATGFATLCIREAITAGISTDAAYAVGDGYIESMAQCKSVSELTSLTLSMYEDFVFRVRKHRTSPKVSSQVRSCRDYIELHAEQELKLAHLARQVGYSEYYLSRKFKREMGISVSAYIKVVRVERSKLMLVSTSQPIAQIADALHFASSSHFSEAFRDITGKTPQQYRTEHSRF